MKTRVLSPHIGVEVMGIDPSRPLAGDAADALRALFRKHRLLLIRGQEIDADAQVRLVSALAPIAREGDGGSDHTFVSTEPHEYVTGRSRILMHSDYNFTPHGQIQVISLCALVLQQSQPTLFANMARAAARLPEQLQERLRMLQVFQVQEFTADTDGGVRARWSRSRHLPKERVSVAAHPALIKHPVTAEDVLNISQQVTSHFVGMSEAESDVLFAEVEPYQYADEDIFAHHWRLGDLVIWDNVALQHGRPELEREDERTLRRVVGNPVSTLEIMSHLTPDPQRFIAPERSAEPASAASPP